MKNAAGNEERKGCKNQTGAFFFKLEIKRWTHVVKTPFGVNMYVLPVLYFHTFV